MQMVVSDRFVNVLKAFTKVNRSVVLQPNAERITALHEDKTFFAEARVSERLPYPVAIQDLPNFIKLLTASKDAPTVTWEESSCDIEYANGMKLVFTYDNPAFIKHTKGSIRASSCYASFGMKKDDMTTFMTMLKSSTSETFFVAKEGDGISMGAQSSNKVLRYPVDPARVLSETEDEFDYNISMKMLAAVKQQDIVMEVMEGRRLVIIAGKDEICYHAMAQKGSTVNNIRV